MLVLPFTGRDEKMLDVRFWHKANMPVALSTLHAMPTANLVSSLTARIRSRERF